MPISTVKNDAIRCVIDAIPACVFVMDAELRVIDCNRVAEAWFGADGRVLLQKKSGEAIDCLNKHGAVDGCGKSPGCQGCPVRSTVGRCLAEQKTIRERAVLEVRDGFETEPLFVLASASPLHLEGQSLALLILERFSDLMELQRMIPICAKCKKIRDERQEWQRMEQYFRDRWDVKFTHGYCPQCKAELIEETRHLLRRDVQE